LLLGSFELLALGYVLLDLLNGYLSLLAAAKASAPQLFSYCQPHLAPK
jgi:hypothetical protein